MEVAASALRGTTTVVAVGAAVAGVVRWRRSRDPRLAALTATVGVLALVLVGGRLAELLPDPARSWVRRVDLTLLPLFPAALAGLAATLHGRRVPRPVIVTTAPLLLAPWLLAEVPGPGAAGGAAWRLYVLAVVAHWVGWSVLAATRLWRAGRGRPTMGRRRLQALASAALLLSVAIVLAAATQTWAQTGATVVVQAVALVATVALVVAFVAPRWLQAWWRRRDEVELGRAAAALLGAGSVEEVVALLLPHLERVLSAERLVYRRDDRRWGAPGDGPPDEVLTGGHGTLEVWRSAAAPLSVDPDLEHRALALLELAVDRAATREREQAVRGALERATRDLELLLGAVEEEIRTPVAAVVGYADTLLADPTLPATLRSYVERIAHNARRVAAVLAELSPAAAVPRESPTVALTGFLERVAARTGHELQADGVPALRLHPEQAEELLAGLVATVGAPPGTTVRIEATTDEHGVVLRVGVTGHRLEQVPSVPASVRRTVEQLGGRLWVEDGGVCVRLPRPLVVTPAEVGP